MRYNISIWMVEVVAVRPRPDRERRLLPIKKIRRVRVVRYLGSPRRKIKPGRQERNQRRLRGRAWIHICLKDVVRPTATLLVLQMDICLFDNTGTSTLAWSSTFRHSSQGPFSSKTFQRSECSVAE